MRYINTSILICNHTGHTALLHKLIAVSENCERQICFLYKDLITQLHIYATAITILAKGYIPISLITQLRLKEILNEVKTTAWKTNPDYDLVIKRLHLYFDMKIVTFGIDNNKI